MEETEHEWYIFAYGSEGRAQPMADLLTDCLAGDAPFDVDEIKRAMQLVMRTAAALDTGINDRCFFHTIRVT